MLRLLRVRYNYSEPSKFAFQKDTNVYGFKHISSQTCHDSNLHLHHLVHENTNSHFYHLENDDPNNCFAPIIKTIIDNNKGAPHILEHLACCGSEKYPIRDPFMNMTRRSLNTYMNAWTGEDFTAYPFSTANQTDFYNLLNVYTDLVFKPKLDYYDFRQEGWRYEVGPNGVEYKGIVLNEMKGVYQYPQRQLWLEVNKNLLNGTPYEYDTGGEPKQIVNLQYDQLKSLYNKFYHPSNMNFYSYGNSNFTSTLDFLNSEYLNLYKKNNNQPEIKSPGKPIHKSTIKTKDESNQIVLAYYLGRFEDIATKDMDALALLSYLLFEGNDSPMYEELIESGLGEVFTEMHGLKADKLVTFSFGIKGVETSHEEFLEKIKSILSRYTSKRFDLSSINRGLIQTEISFAYPSRNKGIKILEKLIGVINHRENVANHLNYKEQLQGAKVNLLKKQYREYLINKYFLKNQNYTVVLQQSTNEVEQTHLVPSDKLQLNTSIIKQQQQNLLKRQQDPIDKSILPTLQIDDVSVEFTNYHVQTNKYLNLKYHFVKIQKGLTHTKVFFSPSKVENVIEKLKLIDLWTYLVTKGVSTKEKSYKQLNKALYSCSNGIHASYGIRAKTNIPYIQLSISSPDNRASRGVGMMGDLLCIMKFIDGDNLNTLLKSYQNDLKNDLIENPLNYGMSFANSLIFNNVVDRGKLLKGLEGYYFAEEYLNQRKTTKELEVINSVLLKQSNLAISIHTGMKDSKIHQKFQAQLQRRNRNYSLSDLIQKNSTQEYKSIVFTQNYDVNYCVASFDGPEIFSKEAARLSLFLQLLESEYLHKRIREQGGAYGSGTKLQDKCVSLYSYADPQCQNTFKVFQQSVNNLLQNTSISDQDLKQARLAIFSRVDAEPVENERGMHYIVHKILYTDILNYRHQVRTAEIKSVLETGEKYFKNKPCHRVVFGKDVPAGFKQINLNFDKINKLLDNVKAVFPQSTEDKKLK